MPFYEKAKENTWLVVSAAVFVVLVLLGVLATVGGL